MPRTILTPGRLYAKLSAEFKKGRPANCTTCRMPFPYLVIRPDEVSANWFVAGFSECHHGCHRVIAEIVARLWPMYDLVDFTTDAREFPDDKMRRRRDPIFNCLNPQERDA